MKFCLTPGCSTRVESGYCDGCRQGRERSWRGSPAERGYGSRWRRRAKAFLVVHPLCGQRPGGQTPVMSRCYVEGRRTAAVQVDHVMPHRGDEGKFWDEANNWQSLCRACGAAKSAVGL